jgi:hypothetical protein
VNNRFKNAMDSIAAYIKEERDVLFLRGLDKGKETFVKYLLNEDNKTFEQIACIAGVAIDFVKAVQRQLTSK